MRRQCLLHLFATILLVSALPSPAVDDSTKKVLAGAAAAAGIAAIIHSQHHHDDSKHHHDQQREAVFERGYRDGLQNARFNDYKDEKEYRKGYDAGIEERQAHIYHNQPNRWEEDRHHAPQNLMHTCALATARHFDLSPGHVTPLSSKKTDHHHLYKITVKYGHHKQAICSIHENGKVEKIKRKD